MAAAAFALLLGYRAWDYADDSDKPPNFEECIRFTPKPDAEGCTAADKEADGEADEQQEEEEEGDAAASRADGAAGQVRHPGVQNYNTLHVTCSCVAYVWCDVVCFTWRGAQSSRSVVAG